LSFGGDGGESLSRVRAPPPWTPFGSAYGLTHHTHGVKEENCQPIAPGDPRRPTSPYRSGRGAA